MEYIRHIDQYLLLNKPLVWRTRIHYLLFYSMVVNVFAAVIASIAPISKSSLPDTSWVESFLTISIPLLCFGGLYWAYTQYKHKLKGGSLADKLLTVSLYGLGVAALIFNLFFAQFAVSLKIANSVDTVTFEEEHYEVYNQHKKGPDIRDIAISYGFVADDIDNYIYTRYELLDIMNEVKYAKEFIRFEGSDVEGYSLGLVAMLILVPMFLVLVSFTGFKNILIVAFIQLIIGIICTVSTYEETGYIMAYGTFGLFLALFLFSTSSKYNLFTEIGHYLLISMVSFFGLFSVFVILINGRKDEPNIFPYLLVVVIVLFFLAFTASMASNLKAKPR